MGALLRLVPSTRIGVKYPGGAFKSERHFLDFVVDGQSLWEAMGKRYDMVSVLCVDYAKDESLKAASRLLLNEKADLPNSRRSFFVCSECGDLGCGAITAVVERQGDIFTWKAFGYQNTYEDEILLGDYNTIGPFTFEAAKYEMTLTQAMDILRGAES